VSRAGADGIQPGRTTRALPLRVPRVPQRKGVAQRSTRARSDCGRTAVDLRRSGHRGSTGRDTAAARRIPHPLVATRERRSANWRTMNRRSFLGWSGAYLATGLGAFERVLAAQTRPEAGTVVTIDGGRLRGLRDGAVHVFKGVPSGASTAGPNRFQPARKPDPWV